MNMIDIDEDDRCFLLPLLEDIISMTTMDYDVGYVVTEEQDRPSPPAPIMDQERYTYQEILKKLETSMKRYQDGGIQPLR